MGEVLHPVETAAVPDAASVIVRVCRSCTAAGITDDEAPAGARLYQRLLQARAGDPAAFTGIAFEPVDCLAVCERPVTLAFQAAGKWSYVIGDADPAIDPREILRAAQAVADSPHGVPKLNRRPPFFRAGVICRLPPAPGSARPEEPVP